MKETDIRPKELFERYLSLAQQDIHAFFGDATRFCEIPCPACGSECAEKAFAKLGFQYVLCSDCLSLYACPRPTAQAIFRYSRESAAVRFWATHFYKETEASRREHLFVPKAEYVANLAGTYRLEGSNFVDVGSGYGVLLEEVAARARFAELTGIEPAPDLARICRDKGFRVIEKHVEDVTPGSLDAGMVTSFEVLEHLFDPLRFLQSIRMLLRPGGICVLTTVTCSGFDVLELWENSKTVHPPHHINLMSTEGIATLFERAGLDVLMLETPGALDVSIVKNAVDDNPEIGVSRFARTLIDDRDDKAHKAFQEFLAAHRLSSHVRVVAKRPD